MISRYGIFCKVIEVGSFTKVAELLGYSQSAVSQNVKALEQELGTALVRRKKDGISLTRDGEQFLPYLQSIYSAEAALSQKRREMEGLENTTVRIGTFTSVNRNLLPQLMKDFKQRYPGVRFFLEQNKCADTARRILEGQLDFGFLYASIPEGLTSQALYQDDIEAVLPPGHHLARYEYLTLRQLAEEPFIMPDEGECSMLVDAFRQQGLSPRIEYTVYDDYATFAMVRHNLGISALYRLVLMGVEEGLVLRPLLDSPQRTVVLAWRSWETMPLAARRFAEFILDQTAAGKTALRDGALKSGNFFLTEHDKKTSKNEKI